MAPRRVPLKLYGAVTDAGPLEWTWVEDQLRSSGTYWVVPRHSTGAPHPRPVWGVWRDDELLLSIGSKVIGAALAADPVVTVHLDSGTDVVVMEGLASIADGVAALSGFIADYDPKYDWSFDIDEYGPVTRIMPHTVVAYRTAGRAGRDGFQQAGKWIFDSA